MTGKRKSSSRIDTSEHSRPSSLSEASPLMSALLKVASTADSGKFPPPFQTHPPFGKAKSSNPQAARSLGGLTSARQEEETKVRVSIEATQVNGLRTTFISDGRRDQGF